MKQTLQTDAQKELESKIEKSVWDVINRTNSIRTVKKVQALNLCRSIHVLLTVKDEIGGFIVGHMQDSGFHVVSIRHDGNGDIVIAFSLDGILIPVITGGDS